MTDQIIVTGGLGFIGSNFIHRLLRSSHENLSVTNIDNESLGSNHANLQDISDDKRYRFVKGDLADYEFTRRILKNAKIIVNFAAQTHVDRSIANAEPFCSKPTDRFKVWPTNRDRPAFNAVMAAAPPVSYDAVGHRGERMVEAHRFFIRPALTRQPRLRLI